MKKVKHIIIPIDRKVIDNSFDIMESQIGLQERTGRNDGPHIEDYHALYHLRYKSKGKNYPYCQMAQGYWLYKANGDSWEGIEFMKTAGTMRAVRWALKQGKLSDNELPIKKHDLLYWKKPGTAYGHVERAYNDFDGLSGRTIGANTSNGLKGSQREGDGIFERYRDFSKPIGSLHPYAIIHFDLTETPVTPFKNEHRVV